MDLKSLWVSPDFLKQTELLLKVPRLSLKTLKRWEVQVVGVSSNGSLIGLVAISDPIKEDSKVAISGLKEAGLEPIIITGDNERTAHAIVKEVGVETVISQVLP